MGNETVRSAGSASVPGGLEERLERGEIVQFASPPFPVATGDDLRFLLSQKLGGRSHKNISFNPESQKAAGFLYESPAQAERLRAVLAAFSHHAIAFVQKALPHYAASICPDRVSLRPEAEESRQLKLTARNDLLHVDAFPSRPSEGWRILRLFVNINPTEPRVWITSDPFPKLFAKYGKEAGLPTAAELSWSRAVRSSLFRLIGSRKAKRTVYDEFMLRFHDYLKRNAQFQEKCAKQVWHFQPGATWMVFTDTVSHAVLRGRYALEHSFFVAPHSLRLPELSPPNILEKACGVAVLPRKAA